MSHYFFTLGAFGTEQGRICTHCGEGIMHSNHNMKVSMKTVWEFRSVDGKQVVRSLRSAQVDDRQLEHEYQRIIYRGDDATKIKEALQK